LVPLALGVWGCLGAPACRASHEAPRSFYREPPAFDWAARRGRCVVVEGFAHGGGKDPPSVRSGTMAVDVELEDPPEPLYTWSPGHSARVRVRGVVSRRADRPVFIQRPGAPPMQGIPVPEGTDLEAARRRWVLEHASVEVVRSARQVEADLLSDVGKDVRLVGVVWSRNDRWWFEHDGVQVRLEGYEAIPDFHTLHGSPMTLHGRLERRPLPRLDWIEGEPSPDVADALVLVLRAVTPPPDWPVTDCPPGR
jgi:hypothetical protein